MTAENRRGKKKKERRKKKPQDNDIALLGSHNNSNEHTCIAQNKKASDALVGALKQVMFQVAGKRTISSQRQNHCVLPYTREKNILCIYMKEIHVSILDIKYTKSSQIV